VEGKKKEKRGEGICRTNVKLLPTRLENKYPLSLIDPRDKIML